MMGHMFHEARLATPGRPLEEHRESSLIGGFENGYFVTDRQVIGRVVRIEMAHFSAFPAPLKACVKSFEFDRHIASVLRETGSERQPILAGLLKKSSLYLSNLRYPAEKRRKQGQPLSRRAETHCSIVIR